MTSDRIKEIQEQTAYPNSVSVKQALLKVWNECAQSKPVSDEFTIEELKTIRIDMSATIENLRLSEHEKNIRFSAIGRSIRLIDLKESNPIKEQ